MKAQRSQDQRRIEELQNEQTRNVRDLQALHDTKDHALNGRHQALDAARIQLNDLQEQHQEGDRREKQLQDDVNKLLGQLRDSRTKLENEQAEHGRQEQKS